jgi:hypothetical protein
MCFSSQNRKPTFGAPSICWLILSLPHPIQLNANEALEMKKQKKTKKF